MKPINLPPADRAIAEALIEPARPQVRNGMTIHEGFRIVALGETGSGKTTMMRMIVYYTIAKGYANYALIHDTKSAFLPEYPQSLQAPNVESWRARGFKKGDIPVVSFRGDPRHDIECSAEDVAAYSKLRGQRGRQTANGEWAPDSHLLVIEELAEAASAGRKHVNAPSVLWALERGRKVGVSTLGTSQSPRKIPLDFIGQATAIVFFRLTGADANYLGERLHLDPKLIRTIAGPNHEGLPNYSYCLYMKSVPWDGEIHRLDPRTARMFD